MPTSAVAKRAFDLALAVPALILTAPLQAVVAVAVRRRLGSPVLFRQTRPGLHGRPFQMLKFRSMLDEDPSRGLVTDAERLTPFGAKLRATSLDELPALWNIVRGDMSLVGPRPLLMSYLNRYSPEQARRHHVKPGLTGLAQVSGRNAVKWDERLRLDVHYVDHHSIRGDLQLIWRTVRPVLARDGVTGSESVTMNEFAGKPCLEGAP
ncbi:sugar transferase [Allobranchiibius sp. GilTou73]|uniref:sugar transferase n=1 Tax=Allobranchiibius sp. GilTou73 TaxID=2904523 RepID=UPI001F1C7B4D|nr:sugar transferase [Allobranchiibius sp. GilTou73]UIJ36308.1 sugar transferase [Allobranchiibius sp. GilTou73]